MMSRKKHMWCDGLSQEEWEEKHSTEPDYLHGYCESWVIDHYQLGDKCVAITEVREWGGPRCLMHSCLLRNDVFVDVRGETMDFQNILDGFDYGEYNVEVYDTLKRFKNRMRKLGVL